MTITARELEEGAAELNKIRVSEASEIRGGVVLLGSTLYIIGAALVAAIDRNTEARKCQKCQKCQATEEETAP